MAHPKLAKSKIYFNLCSFGHNDAVDIVVVVKLVNIRVLAPILRNTYLPNDLLTVELTVSAVKERIYCFQRISELSFGNATLKGFSDAEDSVLLFGRTCD